MPENTTPDAVVDAFFALHHGLPRQGPGSDATTRRLLALTAPLPAHPRALDLGCGPGRSALLLAAEAGAHVTAVDLHQPFIDELRSTATDRGLADRITALNCSMAEVPYPDESFDLVWAEGSIYNIGFDRALRLWGRLIAPGGALVVTECEWATPTPSRQSIEFWDHAYPLRRGEENAAAAREAGYAVDAVVHLPDRDWWDEYYTPLAARAAVADRSAPGMAEAVAETEKEIAMRRDHGADYRYTGYFLRPRTIGA